MWWNIFVFCLTQKSNLSCTTYEREADLEGTDSIFQKSRRGRRCRCNCFIVVKRHDEISSFFVNAEIGERCRCKCFIASKPNGQISSFLVNAEIKFVMSNIWKKTKTERTDPIFQKSRRGRRCRCNCFIALKRHDEISSFFVNAEIGERCRCKWFIASKQNDQISSFFGQRRN